MDIATVCQRQVVTINAGASLREAALLMRERHVGALVVTDSAQTPRALGVVTDRDLAIEALPVNWMPLPCASATSSVVRSWA